MLRCAVGNVYYAEDELKQIKMPTADGMKNEKKVKIRNVQQWWELCWSGACSW